MITDPTTENGAISEPVTAFKFKVHSLRKHPDPIDSTRARYSAIVHVRDVPQNLPLETNPRKQNLDSKVARKIRAGLLGEPTTQIFHLLNRGLLISAKDVKYNNDSNEITLLMTNEEWHGLVDGGHTYKIILDNRIGLQSDQYVHLEILTGIEGDFQEIAGARNTSMQVKDKSLAELEGKLDVIKELVAGLPFEHDIAYVENEDKPIDVLEVIAILSIFNVAVNRDNVPIYAYNSRNTALRNYLEHTETYRRMKGIVGGIFKLHDHVKRTMPNVYNPQGTGRRFGALKEIGYRDGQARWSLTFSPKVDGSFEKVQYDIPAGFTYPILGSLRYLVDADGKGSFRWKTDPIRFYDDEVATTLVSKTMEASKDSGRNPSAVGKKLSHWQSLFDYVARVYLERQAAN